MHFMEFEKIKASKSMKGKGGNSTLEIKWENGIKSTLYNFREKPIKIQLQYVGTKGSCVKFFDDSYNAFKKALLVFLKLSEDRSSREPYNVASQIVRLIEEGL